MEVEPNRKRKRSEKTQRRLKWTRTKPNAELEMVVSLKTFSGRAYRPKKATRLGRAMCH